MRKIRPQRIGMNVPKAASVEKYYPTFSVRLADFPEAKDWEVGEAYDIEMTVRLKAKSEDEQYGGNFVFEIRKIAVDDDEDDTE